MCEAVWGMYGVAREVARVKMCEVVLEAVRGCVR